MLSSASCTSATAQMCTSGTPMAMCIGGKWGPCACAPGSTTGAQTMTPGTTTGTPTASCGNGKAEGDEQCDGVDLKGMTCMTLGMGAASAVLKCNTRCMFDTLMCFAGGASMAAGGTGAGGTGARMTGAAAGAGGTGRK